MQISVGIPSYNEGTSLVNLIENVLFAKLPPTVRLIEVIVSDDSNDRTLKLLTRFADNKTVRIFHHDQRRGVSAAWNEILTESKGDLIVLIDADTIPSDDFLAKISSKSIESDAGLIAANSFPLNPKSFFAKASFFVGLWLQEVRRSFGTNPFTVIGRGLAIKRETAKKIVLPAKLLAPDLYISCRVKELGYEIQYAEEAVVYFKPTTSARDFASQVIRAFLGHRQLKNYSKTTLQKVSFRNLMTKTIRIARHYPVPALATILACILLPFWLPTVIRGASNYRWDIPKTSKFQ